MTGMGASASASVNALLALQAAAPSAPPQAVVAPLLVVLFTAIVTFLVRPLPRVQRGLSLLGSLGYLLAVGWLAATVAARGTVPYQLSGWPAPFGITLVADALSVFMLTFSAALSLAAVAFSVLYVDRFGQRLSYHTLYHLMMVGVTGSFLTGDLFNLFVWFEVLLMASYVLVVFYSGPQQTRATLQYVVLNLVGSALMLVAIGGLYATTGTLNMADMARRLAAPAEYGITPAPVIGLAAVLFVVFALKTGLVPFQFWVPAAYRAAPAPVSAILAGVVKKVGVYAIIRLYFTVFASLSLPAGLRFGLGEGTLAFFGPVLVAMAVASIIVGGIGAVSRGDLDGVLAYSSIGQIGFVVLPMGVAAMVPGVRRLAIAAALIYALNHGIAKTLLFLASGTIQEAVGTVRFDVLGGLTGRAPVLSGSVFVGGLALVGIPPLTGFFGKLFVFDAAGRAAMAGAPVGIVALAASLLGAVLTIAYVSRVWNTGFWGEPTDAVRTAGWPPALIAIVAGLAVSLFVLGVAFGPVVDAANAAADAALDTQGYVAAVDPAQVTTNATGTGAGANATATAGADGGGGGGAGTGASGHEALEAETKTDAGVGE